MKEYNGQIVFGYFFENTLRDHAAKFQGLLDKIIKFRILKILKNPAT